MHQITLPEELGRSYTGELEFIIRDPVRHETIDIIRDHNLVKIFAKEILAHQLAPQNIWDPNASSGTGAWVDSGLDPLRQYTPRYVLFGAAFDENHLPVPSSDPRYYQYDPGSGTYVPIQLSVGADYNGGLINAIPISEPNRPLKRIERIYYESSYQPAGTPLLQPDVRAINNVVVLETTLHKEEYNGFGLTSSDYFTITEVALAAAKEVGNIGACECDPKDLFMESHSGTAERMALLARASGTGTISLDPSELASVDVIHEGDQVKIVTAGPAGTEGTTNILNQVNPYYLVINKALGGSDMVLDRTPVDMNGVPLLGPIGVFMDGLKIFSHRILKSPLKKSSDFEVVCRWRILMS
jgi:hypothetical protein